jgi:hypothetical protein
VAELSTAQRYEVVPRVERRARVALVALAAVAAAAAPASAAAASPTGEIKGKVTEAGGPAIEHAEVCASPVTDTAETCAETGTGGEYTIPKLPPGEYAVRFTGEVCAGAICRRDFAPQYYQDKPSKKAATPVTVEMGVTAEINASLEKGAELTGSVIQAAGGQAIDHLVVCGFAGNPEALSEEEYEAFLASYECVLTNAAGNYTLTGLAAGNYAVQFTGIVCSDEECTEVSEPYALQYYEASASLVGAKRVSVGTTGTVSEINAHLLIAEHNSPPPPPRGAAPSPPVTTAVSTTSPAPGIASGPRGATVKNGTAAIALRCGGGACNGTLKLLARITEKRAVKRHGRSKTVTRSRTVVIGERSFSIAAGESATVEVRLTSKGMSLLRKAGKRGLRVTLSGSGVRAGPLVLKEAAGGHKRQRFAAPDAADKARAAGRS